MGNVTFKTYDQLDQEKLENWRGSAKCSKFQAKAALKAVGRLQEAKDLIASLPEDDDVRLAWEEAIEFRRNSPTLLAMAEQMGMTDEELDQLFEQAIKIEA